MNDYANKVAATIIEQLKQGTAPFVKPWRAGQRFMPWNPTTGNRYRGINALWLQATADEKQYDDARWLTYKQAAEQGAQVRKGEKGTVIQFWQWQKQEVVLDENNHPILDKDGKTKTNNIAYDKPRLFSAVVFNAMQIEGLAPAISVDSINWQRHEIAEQFLLAGTPKIEYKNEDRCYYSLPHDNIVLVKPELFETPDRFYAVALHEKAHWTGHEKRLARDLKHPFGSLPYAREELRAEIASLMLGDQLGIGHDPGQHVAYIKSWITLLNDDPREIFRAAADAEKITQYLNDLTQTKTLTQNPLAEPTIEKKIGSTMPTNQTITYLSVPFSEKELAKSLGAKWDKQKKSWYVPPAVNPELFERWMNNQEKVLPALDPVNEFKTALLEAGLIIKGLPMMDGELHRVPVQGEKNSEKGGSYIGFSDGHPAGYIKNFVTGFEGNWKSSLASKALTEIDRQRLATQTQKQLEERQQAKAAEHQQAAQLASEQYRTLPFVQKSHPYLIKKAITPGLFEVQVDKDNHLVLTLRDIDGNIATQQMIDPEGAKRFLKNGQVTGNFMVVGEQQGAAVLPQMDSSMNNSFVIAEGYATARSISDALNVPVIAAFSSSNILPVAQAIREKFPQAMITIAGDNDCEKEAQGRVNVGKQKAEEAAKAVKGVLLLPTFEAGEKGSDFNDVCNSHSPIKIVRLALQAINTHKRHLEQQNSNGQAHQAAKAYTANY